MKVKVFNHFILVMIALLISVLLNQDRIIRSFHNDQNKHAVPIASSRASLGDDYYYYVAANQSLELGLVPHNKIYSTNNILLGSLVTVGLINQFCHKLIQSSDIAVVVSLLLQTFLLVLATVFAIKVIGRYHQSDSKLWIGFWAFMALVLSEFFLINSYYGAVQFRPLLSYYPSVLRVVNPQIGWAYGLVYFGVLFTALKENSSFRFITLSLLSLFFSIFSPSLCLTMLLAMAIIFVWELIKNRAVNYSVMAWGFLLLLSFLFNYYQLNSFQTSAKGLEIGTGVLTKVVFEKHYLFLLILILPIAKFYKGREFIVLVSILFSSVIIGAFCTSIHLGDRLWVRGAGIYVWIITVILISNYLKKISYNKVCTIIGFFMLSLWTFYLLPHEYENDYAYMNTDKWVLIDWINKNIPANSVIMSDDMEFSFLLPIYTLTKPYVPLFGHSNISLEETIKRYYHTLDAYGTKDELQRKIMQYTPEKNIENILTVAAGKQLDEDSFAVGAFYNFIVYYPFTKFSEFLFQSKEQTEKFFAVLDQWSHEKYESNVQPDFLIIQSGKLAKLGFEKNIIYKTNKYVILSRQRISNDKNAIQ